MRCYYDIITTVAIIKFVMVSITFGYAAISDWVKREINPFVWVPSIITGILINLLFYRYLGLPWGYSNVIYSHIYISLVISIIIIILLAVLSFILGLIGGADVLALISLVSIYPSNVELLHKIIMSSLDIGELFTLLLLPPILIVLLIYLFIAIALMIMNIFLNLANVNDIKRLRLPFKKAIVYIVFGRVMRIKDVISRRFYYPIYIPGFLERFTFNVNENYEVWNAKLRELDPEIAIIVTWGIPMVTFIAIAVYLYGLFYVILMLL